MTHTATYRRLDLGPLTADVTEHHVMVIRYDDDGYTRIHEDALGPLLRSADYRLDDELLDDELHRCPSVHHPGGRPTRCERWLNHEGRHDSPHYSWTDDTLQPAPTEEAAALRSAPLANEPPRCTYRALNGARCGLPPHTADVDHAPGTPQPPAPLCGADSAGYPCHLPADHAGAHCG